MKEVDYIQESLHAIQSDLDHVVTHFKRPAESIPLAMMGQQVPTLVSYAQSRVSQNWRIYHQAQLAEHFHAYIKAQLVDKLHASLIGTTGFEKCDLDYINQQVLKTYTPKEFRDLIKDSHRAYAEAYKARDGSQDKVGWVGVQPSYDTISDFYDYDVFKKAQEKINTLLHSLARYLSYNQKETIASLSATIDYYKMVHDGKKNKNERVLKLEYFINTYNESLDVPGITPSQLNVIFIQMMDYADRILKGEDYTWGFSLRDMVSYEPSSLQAIFASRFNPILLEEEPNLRAASSKPRKP